jgi:phosphoglucosamine mutase
MDVVLLGPMPTPAVGMLTRSLRADIGVMISASHNAFEDNGIKLFGPDGFKLSDAMEAAIERQMDDLSESQLAASDKLGHARRLDDAMGRYIEFVKSTFPRHLRLDGLKVVVDCANGAAYRAAPLILYELGAEVVPLAVTPDGYNINSECGAVSPTLMQEAVVAHGADLGLALDGDADRVVLASEDGRLIDGDQVMALIGENWKTNARLAGNAVVATVMSNLGLERYLQGRGIRLLRTPVGDRYVVERMRSEGCNVGGEQSGHIVLSDHSTTGDGLIAALQVLSVLVEKELPASEVTHRFEPLPQRLENLRYEGEAPLGSARVQAAIAEAEASLKEHGRLLIRPSGTEPVIRVMVEAEEQKTIDEVMAFVCGVIEAETGETTRLG